ncbi:MAG: alpha/beta hydrolase [Calditrichia bacterium]
MLKDDKNLHASIFYEGIPVVFLHAFPVNHKMWQPQMDYLRSRGVGYIAPDYPGFGMSPLVEEEMGISGYGNYIYALLQEMGIRRAIFAGLSMGGYVALSLFRNYPLLFGGLILANTRAADDNPEARQNRLDTVERIRRTLNVSPLIDNLLEKFFTQTTRSHSPETMETAESLMREATVAGVIQAQRAMASRPDSTALLKEMHFPVTVISGEDDPLIPMEEMQAMAAEIPAASFHVIRKAAHLSNLERPDEFNDIMWQLIQKSR